VNYYREYNKEKVSNSFIAREAVKGFLSVVAVLCDLVIIYVVIKTKKTETIEILSFDKLERAAYLVLHELSLHLIFDEI
jgi:hypothetical protein